MKKRLGLAGIGVAASAVALSVALPPSASAAGLATLESSTGFIDHGDNTLVYNAHGPTDNRVTLKSDGAAGITFTDPAVVMIPITNYWFNPVAPAPLPSLRCDIGVGESSCGKGPYNIGIRGNDGNDRITVRRINLWFGVYVHCGAGNDIVHAYHSKVFADPDCEQVIQH